MKYLIILVLCSLLVITSISIACAGESDTMIPTLNRAANIWQLTGNVSAVHVDLHSVAVSKKIGDRVIAETVMVDAETLITAGDATKTLADLKPGDKAVVSYAKSGGTNIAKSIAIVPEEQEPDKN